MHNVVAGMKAENFFASMLNNKGILYEYVDTWYDFLINKKCEVEVKSCQPCVKCGNRAGYRFGRFDFTNEDNRKLQNKYNIWTCFILRHKEQFILLGFYKAKKLENKRYVPLSKVLYLPLLNFEQWLSEVNND